MLRFAKRSLSTLPKYNTEVFLATNPSKHVLHLQLNRPEFKNSMNKPVWDDMVTLFKQADRDPEVRAIILSGASIEGDQKPVFSAGIDLGSLMEGMMEAMAGTDDPARRFMKMRTMILDFQESITVIEKCKKPVIAAVTGAAVGGAIDILAACDIRYCDESAWFSIKEVDVGLAADIGTLQRMGKVCGNESTVKELALTARRFDGKEAHEIGFMSSVAVSKEEMMDRVFEVAKTIAEKSPLATQGTKVAINYARDHSIADSLEQIATWNGAALLSEDLIKSAQAVLQRKGPEDIEFEDV